MIRFPTAPAEAADDETPLGALRRAALHAYSATLAKTSTTLLDHPSLGHAIGRAAQIIPTDSGLLLPIKASYNEGTYRALLQDTGERKLQPPKGLGIALGGS